MIGRAILFLFCVVVLALIDYVSDRSHSGLDYLSLQGGQVGFGYWALDIWSFFGIWLMFIPYMYVYIS